MKIRFIERIKVWFLNRFCKKEGTVYIIAGERIFKDNLVYIDDKGLARKYNNNIVTNVGLEYILNILEEIKNE